MLRKTAKLIFLLLAPALLAMLAAVFLFRDLWTRARRRATRRAAAPPPAPASASAPFSPPEHASIVIPNWNGKDLLEAFLPSVVAECGPQDEIIVVDNASSDGSAEFLRERFPQVRLLQMERNRGFGGGCNAGVRAARHRTVVLLNNDMRVAPGFLAALLEGFHSPEVFAVSAQIFFSDPARRREETGMTTGRFTKGFFHLRHEVDEQVNKLYPVFYAGGGSTAYDREKFLELGGFDPLFEPFYLEDTDLSFNAWRRGWQVLYQPRARVYHEHRGTIGKHYNPQTIQLFLQKNHVLMVWKNLHQPAGMLAHWAYLYGHMLLNALGGPTPTRTTIGAFLAALRQLPQALRARRNALWRSALSDAEVLHRLRPAVFQDVSLPSADLAGNPPDLADLPQSPLNILFVSPYSIYPPLHGGAVFMLQAIQQTAKRHRVFVLTFVDSEEQAAANSALRRWAREVRTVVRRHRPARRFHWRAHAQQAFADAGFAALLDQMVYLHDIDLIQFEYTQMAQYRLPLRHIPQCLFEHDIYFRSVGRQLWSAGGSWSDRARAMLEWLRALRYEVGAVAQFDAVFTCHEQEQRLLESLIAGRPPRILSGLRTAVDVASYPYPGGPRQPDSLLFVGSFQHRPNVEGLAYFCREVFPRIRQRRPGATLNIVGAGASPAEQARFSGEGIRLLGEVPDIRAPFGRYSVFVCPIRSGAGVRVKILEAFASGIPVVSTSLGAEGLAARDGQEILLADSPAAFAEACARLLEEPRAAQAQAAAARRLVEANYDWPLVMERLDRVYRELVLSKRGTLPRRRAQPLAAPSQSLIAR